MVHPPKLKTPTEVAPVEDLVRRLHDTVDLLPGVVTPEGLLDRHRGPELAILEALNHPVPVNVDRPLTTAVVPVAHEAGRPATRAQNVDRHGDDVGLRPPKPPSLGGQFPSLHLDLTYGQVAVVLPVVAILGVEEGTLGGTELIETELGAGRHSRHMGLELGLHAGLGNRPGGAAVLRLHHLVELRLGLELVRVVTLRGAHLWCLHLPYPVISAAQHPLLFHGLLLVTDDRAALAAGPVAVRRRVVEVAVRALLVVRPPVADHPRPATAHRATGRLA